MELENRHIFISYSKEDIGTAEAVYEFLCNNNIKCWLATKNAVSSKSYVEEIITAIKDSVAVIVIFSHEANGSDFVKKELERAITYKIPIFVFRIDDSKPDGEMEFFISASHWLNVYEEGFENSLERLFSDCSKVLNKTSQINNNIKQRFFSKAYSFNGRIRRLEFGVSIIMFLFIWLLHGYVILRITNNELNKPTKFDGALILTSFILQIWFLLSQSVKRAHDLNESGWRIFNPLFWYNLFFKKGSAYKNNYGSNPKKLTYYQPKVSYYRIIPLLAILAFLLYLNYKPTHSYKQVNPNWKSFENNIFRIEYPTSWSIDSSPSPPFEVFIYSVLLDTDSFQENVSFGTKSFKGRNISFARIIRMTENEIKADNSPMKNCKILSSEDTLINNRKCRRILFTGHYTQSIRSEVYLWYDNSTSYFLTFSSQNFNNVGYKDTFNSILKSVILKYPEY